jgi:outer membrane protein OmpA-like peptidoglycan-associated protein
VLLLKKLIYQNFKVMSTTVHDDYLICREYQEQIDKKSTEYPGFISFQHENGNYYFAWINDNHIVLRSEAYPDAEKMERGIKAILKNCDLPERYSLIEEHGAHILVLWGGGDHQAHSGNMESHNEIGRSCPKGTREELNAMLQFKGSDFANKIVPINQSASNNTAAAVTAAAASVVSNVQSSASEKVSSFAAETKHQATSYVNEAKAAVAHHADHTVEAATGGGMKWLLPVLITAALGGLAWFMLRNGGCGAKSGHDSTAASHGTATSNATAATSKKIAIDSVTGVVTYDLGAASVLELPNGNKLNVAQESFERTLVNFIKNGKIDTVDKKANWFNLHDVQFKSAKTEYATEKAMTQIKNVAAVLKAYPNVVLKLGGYTDISGDPVKNKALSQSRADQVKKDLIANGAAAAQIKEAVGYGSEFAEAKLGDKEGMAKDRKTGAKVASM